MKITLRGYALLLTTMSLTMLGCTTNQPFRTRFEPAGPEDPSAVIVSTDEYKMGFVEFDDQGWFWDIRQRDAVEQMIRDEAGIGSVPAAAKQGIVLVAFVHGWKDNAASDGEGVLAFRQILSQLNAAEQSQKTHAPRNVVGVYVGWRGLSAKWEPFMELSFWNRKETAHKVGGYGAMTKLMVDLEDIQKDSLKALPPDAPRTELIIIGHSMGAAAVYSALSQIITERFVNSLEKGKRLKPLGDQIILLNPAFEALRHYDLNQMALAIKQYPEDQRPVLSIFTSRGDWATHYVFPIGQFFSTLFENNRDSAQKTASLETAGWYEPFITHQLLYDVNAALPATQPEIQADLQSGARPSTRTTTFNLAANKHEFHARSELQMSVDNVQAQRSKWHPNGQQPQTYFFDDTILKPKDDFHPGDPFLIASVDPQIMRDHSDISNTVLINFLREYIQFCQTDVKDHSR